MVSPDQAEKAAESLLAPPKNELAARQEKFSKRRARRARAIETLIPSAAAAAAALASVDYFSNTISSFYFGVFVGVAVGLMVRRNAQ